jgi:MFS family permease
LDSSVALGLLGGTFGGGALAGTVVYGMVGPRLPRWPVFTAAFLFAGGPRFLLFAVEPSYAVLLVASTLFGFACGAINPVLSAVEYERIPEELQSRIFGVTAAGCLVGMPVGVLSAGFATEAFGLRPTLLVLGALYLLVTLTPLVWPVWRQMDRSAPEEGRGADPVERHQHDALEPRALAVEDHEQRHDDRQHQHGDEQGREHQREAGAHERRDEDEDGREDEGDLDRALQDH